MMQGNGTARKGHEGPCKCWCMAAFVESLLSMRAPNQPVQLDVVGSCGCMEHHQCLWSARSTLQHQVQMASTKQMGGDQ